MKPTQTFTQRSLTPGPTQDLLTIMLVIFLIGLFLPLVNSQSQCYFPNLPRGRNITCESIKKWDSISRTIDVPTAKSLLQKTASLFGLAGASLALADSTPSQMAQNRFACMDWGCVCNFMSGGQYSGNVCTLPGGGQLRQLPRRELRYLTAAERTLYVQGFNCARNDIYSPIAAAHADPSQSPGAHSGPCFLLWHREMLKRMEIGIRTCNVNGNYPFAGVTIPMWDCTQDADITDYMGISAGWSMMFSSELMGSVSRGAVTDGMFAGFSGRQGATTRQLDQFPGDLFLMRRADVQNMISTHTRNQVMAATAGGQECPYLPSNTLELNHGDPHVWLGGNMAQITTSTNDPMFFCHHAFIDFVWDQWRMSKQTPAQRENDYNTAPTSCYSKAHLPNAVMFPFNDRVCSDGLSNLYTLNMYYYQGFPTCSNCSPYCFCHSGIGRCIGRVKPRGPCRMVNGVDPCYKSTCSSRNTNLGSCSAPQSDVGEPTKPIKQPPHVIGTPVTYESCFNTHPCCSAYADKGECKTQKGVMRVLCPMACGYCKPKKTYTDDCSDRHLLCKKFFLQGKCATNKDFMAENCRKTCSLCKKTRKQTCFAVSATPSKPTKPVKKPINNGGIGTCYNDNQCCRYWKQTIGCSKMSTLKKACKASCSCTPKYDINACADFLPNCAKHKKDGLCDLDQIKENCRKTCNCCHSNDFFKKICT